MLPLSLLATAERLLKTGNGAPSQTNLRRAHSTVYYALFHCLARDCADMLIGSSGANRSMKAWAQVYRSLNHGKALQRCERAIHHNFPETILEFGAAFKALQIKRHKADYDPLHKLSKEEVRTDIEYARQVMSDFKDEATKHRRAFAAYVLLEKRGD